MSTINATNIKNAASSVTNIILDTNGGITCGSDYDVSAAEGKGIRLQLGNTSASLNIQTPQSASSSSQAFRVYRGTEITASILNDGSITAAGGITSITNIGVVDVGTDPGSGNSTDVGCVISPFGLLKAQRQGADNVFEGYDNRYSTPQSTITAEGSITAAGTLKAGTDNFFEWRPAFGACQLYTTSSDRNQSLLYGQSQVGGSTFDAFKLSCNGSTSLGNFNDKSNTAVGIMLDINTNSAQYYQQADSSYNTANSAMEVWLGTTRKWRVTYGGVASYSNVVFDLDPDNSANYVSTTNADGETESVYNGPTLDVKDKLQKADGALTAIKSAVSDSSTDLAGLKAAILAALSNH